MTFGEAIAHIKKDPNSTANREGWNGKGMYIAHVFGSSGTVGSQSVSFLPFVAMRTAQGEFIPWLASQADVLANDWVLDKVR